MSKKIADTTTKAEYSWSDLLDKVADLRAERDGVLEDLENERAKVAVLRDELQDALTGNRQKSHVEGYPG